MFYKEIAEYEWKDFLDSFSKQHFRWHTYIERLNKNGIKELISGNKYLKKISINLSEKDNLLEIKFKDKSGPASDFKIKNVKDIFLMEKEEDVHQGLKIISSGGDDVLIRFRSTINSDMLDGIVR